MMLYSFTADHYSPVSCARTATVQRWAAIKTACTEFCACIKSISNTAAAVSLRPVVSKTETKNLRFCFGVRFVAHVRTKKNVCYGGWTRRSTVVRAYYWFAMENGCCRADIIIIVIIITTMNISDNNNRGVHIGRGERSRDGAEGHLCCGGRSSRGLRVYIQSVSVERPVSVRGVASIHEGKKHALFRSTDRLGTVTHWRRRTRARRPAENGCDSDDSQ